MRRARIADVRLRQDGPLLTGVQNAFRISGLIVVPRLTGKLFGYERGPGGRAPWLVKTLIRRRLEGSRLVAWEQVQVPACGSACPPTGSPRSPSSTSGIPDVHSGLHNCAHGKRGRGPYIVVMTWTELVMGSAPSKGDQPAVSDVRTGEVLSYAAFTRRVTRAAAGLRRDGLAFGDHVLVDLPLGASLPVAVHAVAWAGGVAVLGGSGRPRVTITQGPRPPAVAADKVYAFRPAPGALPFAGLLNASPLEFGPLAGEALRLGGGRAFDHDELAADLRNLTGRLVVGKDDVVVNAAGDLFKGLRVLDLAMMSGAHAVIAAGEPTVVGCRVLAAERRATMVVAPYEVARRLLGDPMLRVVDERAIVSSLGL